MKVYPKPIVSQTSAEKPKRIISVGKKRFENVNSNYRKQMEVCNNLRDSIESTKQILKDKFIIIPGRKGEEGRKQKLNLVALSGYQQKLNSDIYALKLEEVKLKSVGKTYLNVNTRNKKAAQYKTKKFNRIKRLERESKKLEHELIDIVRGVIKSSERKNDQSISTLKDIAGKSSIKFYNSLFSFLRTSLKGKSELELILASSEVKRNIFNTVREHFGYIPKK